MASEHAAEKPAGRICRLVLSRHSFPKACHNSSFAAAGACSCFTLQPTACAVWL